MVVEEVKWRLRWKCTDELTWPVLEVFLIAPQTRTSINALLNEYDKKKKKFEGIMVYSRYNSTFSDMRKDIPPIHTLKSRFW